MPKLVQGQVDSLVQELVVLEVAVDEDHVPDALVQEGLDQVARHADEGGAIQAGRTREVVAAAGLLLRLVPVGDRLGNQCTQPPGDSFREVGGQDGVRSQRKVRAVLLQGPDGNENDRLPDAKASR